jgi:hypothetical protein
MVFSVCGGRSVVHIQEDTSYPYTFRDLVMGWVVLWTKKIVYHSHELTYKPARVDSFNK